MLQDVLPIEDEDGKVGGLQQQMNDNVPYASQERQELIEVRILSQLYFMTCQWTQHGSESLPPSQSPRG